MTVVVIVRVLIVVEAAGVVAVGPIITVSSLSLQLCRLIVKTLTLEFRF